MSSDENIPVINLAGKHKSGRESTVRMTPAAAAGPGVPPADVSGMTLAQLRTNYESILHAHGIYYPVAYQFARELGRGRQGTVFLGLRQGARGCITEHAIKVMDPEIYHSAEEYWTDMGRIAFQISRLQRLRSPNIVISHAYDETQGIGYVQMEAIDGVDVRRFLSRDTLAMAQTRSSPRRWARFTQNIFNTREGQVRIQPGIVVHIMRGVLRGLESLHAMGFLHSDVKPANIMIDRLGYIKLVDFGRAVVAGEKQAFLMGSPMYMAPELHRRENADFRSDLYSVGLVGLELLRGERLADADDTTEQELLRIKMELPDKLSKFLPRNVLANQELVAILRKFIHPDPAKRYASAMDAEVGPEGLLVIERQLVKAELDTEYEREVADYLATFLDKRTDRIEISGDRPATANRPG